MSSTQRFPDGQRRATCREKQHPEHARHQHCTQDRQGITDQNIFDRLQVK
jgi:hypothetical protein